MYYILCIYILCIYINDGDIMTNDRQFIDALLLYAWLYFESGLPQELETILAVRARFWKKIRARM